MNRELNLKELNQVTGGYESLVEELKDQLTKEREHNRKLNKLLCEQHKEIEELKQKILVLETLLKTSQPIVIIN